MEWKRNYIIGTVLIKAHAYIEHKSVLLFWDEKREIRIDTIIMLIWMGLGEYLKGELKHKSKRRIITWKE